MKRFSAALAALLLSCSLTLPCASALELVVGAKKVFHIPGRGQDDVINVWDTATGDVRRGELIPDMFRDALTGVAMAPDNRLYFAECSERVDASDTGFEVCVPAIKRVLVTVAADGSVSHGPEETVYRSPVPFALDEWTNELTIQDIAIRQLDDAGNYRVYFSTGGCGACAAEPNIYYLDDAGVPHHYYTVPRDEIGVSSCEGLSGHWSGNFDFDADGELYLSSGNHCPAGLFHVPGTTADRATRDPVMIDERTCGGILHFMVDAPDRYYFVGHNFEPIIIQRIPDTDAETVALDIPLSWLDPPTGPSAGVWLAGFDRMFRTVSPGDPPMMRGPSISGRRFRLPRTQARKPLQPEARIEGSLLSRLPIPPRPDPKATLPDLIVAGLETGKPVFKGDTVQIPLRVFVRNNGLTAKKPVKLVVSAQFSGREKLIEASFAVHGQRDQSQPELARLHAGEVTAIGGIVTMQRNRNKLSPAGSVAITATADGCEASAGSRCRIKESNEINNRMTIMVPLHWQR